MQIPMLATIIVLYLFLKFYLEMEEEQVYKYMIILCIVNLVPILIYTTVSYTMGSLDSVVLVLMTLL